MNTSPSWRTEPMAHRAAPDIGGVEIPRPADAYADLIRDKIVNGELTIGTQLPPERVLVEESGLTRSIIREALARLQRQGLIVTRPGRGGGSVVSRPTPSAFMSSVDLQLQGWAPGTQMLYESRQVIEPWCAYFAAERRTHSDLKRLQAINDEAAASTSDLPAFIDCKIRWHTTIATASRNDLLSTFMEAVSRAILRQTDVAAHRDPVALQRSLSEHRAVTQAIEARDSASAYRLMTHHSAAAPQAGEDTDTPSALDHCSSAPRRPA